jgi:hypothetical protein
MVYSRSVQPFQTSGHIEKYEARCGPNSSFRTQWFKFNDMISNQFQFNIYIVFIASLSTAFIWNILPSYEYVTSYAQKSQIFVSATFIENSTFTNYLKLSGKNHF